MAEVKLTNLWKKYGEVEAVKDLSLVCRDKEFLCLLGPSGCGKTSTLRMIAGLESITAGEIYINERLVNYLKPKDRDIAMVFETYALYPTKTVYENMAFPLRIRKLPRDDIDRKVLEAAQILDISVQLNRKPAQLSGGQRQRVSIGRAIVRDPEVFLMDEPISHLDAKLREHMRGELKRMQKELDATTIYVTHDQVEALSMADKIAVMNFGELQQFGTPDEIYNRPANKFVANFVGSPSMNFIDCEFGVAEKRLVLELDGFTISLEPDVERLERLLRQASSRKAILGIRPEHVCISMSDTGAKNRIAGKIYVTEPLGDIVIVDVMIGKGIVRVKCNTGGEFPLNENVWLELTMDKIHLFDKETEKIIF
jgi:multiple sugar transport system ATP-binding protein